MDAKRDVIAVSGATGKQGGAVARQLLAQGCRVRALTRKPEGTAAKAIAGLGAEVVEVNFDDLASVDRALSGAWGAFAVQNTWEAGIEREEQQGKTFAERARKQGVQHYVYSSVGSAHRKTGIPHFDNKERVEETVRALQFPSHMILRPVFFMENLLQPSFGLPSGKLIMPLSPTTPLQMIAVDDIGQFGAQAFIRHAELNRRDVDVAGDSLTIPRAAEIVSEVIGAPVRFEQQPLDQMRAYSEDSAIMFEWFERVGYDAPIDTLERIYGIKLTSFRDWAVANRSVLVQLRSPGPAPAEVRAP